MKKKEEKKNKQKKKLLLLLGIGVLTVLGSTIAYFTTSTDITNYFKVALYQNEIVEQFISPDNWTPGTTTDKTITVKHEINLDNEGYKNMAATLTKDKLIESYKEDEMYTCTTN